MHGEAEFLSTDGDAWPYLAAMVDEINIEVDRNLHGVRAPEPPIAPDVPAAPATRVLRKRKRGRELGTRADSPPPTRSHKYARSESPFVPFPAKLQPRPPQPPTTNTRDDGNIISLREHKVLVKTWRRDGREPWVVPPKNLLGKILAYISRPKRERDRSLLPKDPAERSWLIRRCSYIVEQKERVMIADEDSALHAALVEAHSIVEHRNARSMGDYLKRFYLLRPGKNFLELWCSHCPGCRDAE